MIWDALTQSAILHVRNLTEFLYPTKKRAGDVLAEDFCPPRHWNRVRGNITPALKSLRKQANEQVTHLTIGRRVGNTWSEGLIIREIKPPLERFV